MDTQSNPNAPAEQPKKFIRTLASDLEILKKGGKPELTPFGGVSTTVPAPQPIPTPPSQQIAIPPVSVAENSREEKPNPLKTYSEDFLNQMKETGASTATVLAAEQNAAPAPAPSAEEPRKKTSIWYIIGGVVFVAIGVIGVLLAYERYVKTTPPAILEPIIESRIFVEERAEVSGTGANLMAAIAASVNDPLRKDGVRLLYLPAPAQMSVFGALALPAPGALTRNISAKGSMAGVIRIGETQSAFFILPVVTFGDTFGAMLRWELAMPKDLMPLFPPYPQASEEAVASTTSPMPVFAPGFFDDSISNHDVRVYRDSSGRDIVVYGYWDEKTLVIVRDSAAFAEILERLSTSRAAR